MTPPRSFIRVEWLAAVSHDRPDERRETGRNFTSRDAAARQVRSIRSWPTHLELIGVWRTGSSRSRDLHWIPVDPDSLPLAEHVDAHYRTLEASRAGLAPSAIAELIGTTEEDTE